MTVSTGQHVPPEALAAYLDHRLDDTRRAAVVAHLADCADCRAELIDVRRVLQPGRTRRAGGVIIGLAIAASVLFAILPGRGAAPGAGAGQVRGDPEPTALLAYGPLGELPETEVTIRWGAAGPDAAYRVALTTADGAAVWRTSTADTVARLPDSVSLARGTMYRWWVDALLPDGTTRSTGIREFRTPP